LIGNTLVSGPQDYTVMDRWSLSRDRNTLTIHGCLTVLGITSGNHCVRLCGAKAIAYRSFQLGEGGMSTCGKILSKVRTGFRKLFQCDRSEEHTSELQS